jgi:hypothetical protein
MVSNKIGEGGGGEKARLARLARRILVAYMEPKSFFFHSSSGKFSSAAPSFIFGDVFGRAFNVGGMLRSPFVIADVYGQHTNRLPSLKH